MSTDKKTVDVVHATARPLRGSETGLQTLALKDLRKVECQHGVQAFVGNQHVLVLHVERDAAGHSQDTVRSADGPPGGDVAAVADAPHADVRFVGGEFGVGARATNARQDFALLRINSERTSERVETALGTADYRFRFGV